MPSSPPREVKDVAVTRSTPAPFLLKTLAIVNDPETDEIVSWSEGGNSFIVWRTEDFCRDILPRYFKVPIRFISWACSELWEVYFA
jgi:hypothetical protein